MRRVKFKVVRVYSYSERCSAFTRGNYTLNYPENSTVRAREGTLGIAVFGTREQAGRLINSDSSNILRIIRVRPVGRGKTVKLVCDFPNEYALDVFYSGENEPFNVKMKPPPGTIFYPAVEVLE